MCIYVVHLHFRVVKATLCKKDEFSLNGHAFMIDIWYAQGESGSTVYMYIVSVLWSVMVDRCRCTVIVLNVYVH